MFASLIICLTLYILAYNFDASILYNKKSIELNIIGMVLLFIILNYFLVGRLLSQQLLLKSVFLIVSGLFLNFTVSLMVDFFARVREYQHESNDMSFVIIIPATFIVAFVFGVLFDKRVKKYKLNDISD